jgi:hypothetical protein
MRVSIRLLLLNAEVTKRRAARERRRRLQRDLACFATPADRDDLLAILERYPDPIAHEVRSILDRQAAQQLFTERGAAAFHGQR